MWHCELIFRLLWKMSPGVTCEFLNDLLAQFCFSQCKMDRIGRHSLPEARLTTHNTCVTFSCWDSIPLSLAHSWHVCASKACFTPRLSQPSFNGEFSLPSLMQTHFLLSAIVTAQESRCFFFFFFCSLFFCCHFLLYLDSVSWRETWKPGERKRGCHAAKGSG